MTWRTRVKICGVTDPANAAGVVAAGADFLGLNFWPESRRYLEPARVDSVVIAARAAGPIQLVGVFVNADLATLRGAVAAHRLDVVQLHGDEDPHAVRAISAALGIPVWKAVALGEASELDALQAWDVDALVLDTASPGRGGSGIAFDWALAAEARTRSPGRRFVLAGGLTPQTVAEAIAVVRPWAVDVASGVEWAPGSKDLAAVAAFVTAARL